MESCFLCLKSGTYTTSNDTELQKFWQYTSSILPPPSIEQEKSVCKRCFDSAKSTIVFIDNILKANKKLKVSGSGIKDDCTSKETSNALAKIQKIGNIVIKKVSSKISETSHETENFQDPSEYLELEQNTNDDYDDSNLPEEACEEDDDFNDMIEETAYDDVDSDSDSTYNPGSSAKPRKRSVGNSNPNPRKINYVKEIVLDGPTAYTCSKCHSSYPSYDNLYSHMKLGKCFQEELICKLCKKVFETRKRLSSHMASHKPKDSFLCEECSRIFKNQFSLDIHIQSVHRRVEADEAIFACSLENCQEKFFSHPDLADHIKEHAREKKEAERLCEDCGKKCANLRAYQAHIKIHSDLPKPYKCPSCPKSFRREVFLLQHSHVHTGIKAFACDICSKAFAKRESLVNHRREHQNYYPYSCPNCTKSFVSSMKLKTHAVKCQQFD